MARLDFTATNVLTASEMDELARQAISNVTNAGKPTGVAEGETIAVTDKDRHEIWNGAAWVRATNWAAAGRTYVDMIESGSGVTIIGDNVSAAIGWDPGTDPDGFYTDYDGVDYEFTVPATLGGVYAISVFIDWSAAWVADPADFVQIEINAAPFLFAQNAASATYSASMIWPLNVADTVAVRVLQKSGGNKTIDSGNFFMVRLCI